MNRFLTPLIYRISSSRFSLDTTKLFIAGIGFMVWCLVFLFRDSILAIDGNRYFILFDDAMISMRYAWNLAHGQGLVWNPGERVEGYTNLLMVLLMTLASLLFNITEALRIMQFLGIGLMLTVAYLSLKITDQVLGEKRKISSPLIFVLALSYYPLSYWTLTGMETGLLTVLLYLGLTFSFSYKENHKLKYSGFAALCFGLAYLTRPDSILASFIILAYAIGSGVKSTPIYRTFISAITTGSIFLTFVLGQSIFRWFYYGKTVPNTYLLKVAGIEFVDRLENGLGFITLYGIYTFFILLVITVSIIKKPNSKEILIFVLLITQILYQIWMGGDAWPYWRLMAPFMPLIFILFAQSIITLLEPFKPHKLSLTLIVLLGILSANGHTVPEAVFAVKPYRYDYKETRINTALALNELILSEATVGVFAAGAIPYFTQRQSIDFLGKCDPYIAQLSPDQTGAAAGFGMKSVSGHNKYDLEYSIKTLLPTYVQDLKWGRQDLSDWAETKYILVKYKGQDLYLLKDSPLVRWEKIIEE
jgi:arabinofuranosyltransferase